MLNYITCLTNEKEGEKTATHSDRMWNDLSIVKSVNLKVFWLSVFGLVSVSYTNTWSLCSNQFLWLIFRLSSPCSDFTNSKCLTTSKYTLRYQQTYMVFSLRQSHMFFSKFSSFFSLSLPRSCYRKLCVNVLKDEGMMRIFFCVCSVGFCFELSSLVILQVKHNRKENWKQILWILDGHGRYSSAYVRLEKKNHRVKREIEKSKIFTFTSTIAVSNQSMPDQLKQPTSLDEWKIFEIRLNNFYISQMNFGVIFLIEKFSLTFDNASIFFFIDFVVEKNCFLFVHRVDCCWRRRENSAGGGEWNFSPKSTGDKGECESNARLASCVFA